LCAALAAACSGGGGGSGNTAPTITAAVFVGSAGIPAAGDALLLLMSEDVTLVAGALLTDADFVFAGGTLGAVSAAPTLINSRSVRIVLGAGVSFLPGTATIAFGDDNDAVRDLAGAFAKGGTARTITAGDGNAPTITRLTLSNVDGPLNGTGPAGGTLQVPQRGFTIDVTATDATSAINPAATQIAASVNVNTAAGSVPAGQNLTPSLGAATVNGNTYGFLVPGTVSFPEGPITLTVIAVDITGMTSAPATFAFRVRNLSDAVRPFETTVNAQQVWFLDLSRDVESFSVANGAGPKPVGVVAGANGTPDFHELLTMLGLFGGNATVNTAVLDTFRNRLTAELGTLFAGVNIGFTFTAPGTFPPQTAVPYNSFGFAQICIAGAEDPAGNTGILGVAIFDPNNASQENDCLLDFLGAQRLGVFVHTAVDAGFRESGLSTFRTTYDALRPDLVPAGTPIGNAGDGMDAGRVAGTVTDGRGTTIQNAINRLARFIAVVTAHECGHSMGLVMMGPMPTGLYGGDPVNFPGSGIPPSPHIRNDSLFPPGAQNVMSPAISFTSAIVSATAFNSLNLAYLRERALYNN
jgi:hypothetical protein